MIYIRFTYKCPSVFQYNNIMMSVSMLNATPMTNKDIGQRASLYKYARYSFQSPFLAERGCVLYRRFGFLQSRYFLASFSQGKSSMTLGKWGECVFL